VASRRALATALVGLTSFGLAALISTIRIPVPRMHDEFSYLLAADTFASGRLTNPTPPLWHHFETFHVLMQPTYASKYPPAQGLFLALGTVVGGHPIGGVWLAIALAAAACCWMLQGFVPARFALLGGVLVAFHHGLQFYWQNYWGGSVALLGGALLYGALPRLWRRPAVGPSLALAAGLALLANSRPYTGLVAALPVALALAVRFAGRRRPAFVVTLRRFVAPVAAVLVVVAAGMLYYDARVTGDPFRLPYQVHGEQYAYTPVFLMQSPRPAPAYRNQMFERFHLGWQSQGYQEQQSIGDSFARKRKNLYFFVTPLLMVPLLTFPWLLRSRKSLFALASVGLVFGASLAVTGVHAHYIAPVAPMLFLLVVQGLRQCHLWRPWGRPVGHWLVVAIALIQVAIFAAAFVLYRNQPPPEWATRRAEIQDRLEAMGGKHLVVVHYSDSQSPHEEWVWNRADIDAARVVWARSLGADEDRELLEHFGDRRLWELRPDRVGDELHEIDAPTRAGP